MAIARRPAPRSISALQHVHHARERRIGRKREPIAQRLNVSVELIFQIVRHARERVAPLLAHLVGDIFVAAGERNRLERDRLNLVDVLRGKLDDLTDAVVVDVVDDRRQRA